MLLMYSLYQEKSTNIMGIYFVAYPIYLFKMDIQLMNVFLK